MTRAEKMKKWIKALRSGRYKQVTGALHQRVGTERWHCCLGVAEVACRVNKNNIKEIVNGASYPRLAYFLGLSDEQEEKLIALNDRDKKNFLEIADYIEKHIA